MAANYSKPVTTDAYADILTQLRDNITAAQTMLSDLTGVTNIPTNAVRYDQTLNKLQSYNGSTFDDLVLSPSGGGTGSTSAVGTAAFLDFGTGPDEVPKNSSLGTYAYEDFDAGPFTNSDYTVLPGGLVLMWAFANGVVPNAIGSEISVVVNFPTTLNSVLKVVVSQSGDLAEAAELTYAGHTVTTSSVTVKFRRNSGGNSGTETVSADVFVVGT